MATLHKGIDNRLLGRIQSDEEFTKRIHHLMDLKRAGKPLMYYTGKYNEIRVKHGNTWWLIDDLSKHLPELQHQNKYQSSNTKAVKKWYQVDGKKNMWDFYMVWEKEE